MTILNYFLIEHTEQLPYHDIYQGIKSHILW